MRLALKRTALSPPVRGVRSATKGVPRTQLRTIGAEGGRGSFPGSSSPWVSGSSLHYDVEPAAARVGSGVPAVTCVFAAPNTSCNERCGGEPVPRIANIGDTWTAWSISCGDGMARGTSSLGRTQ